MIRKIELSNISDAYSAKNMMKFDISNDTQKHLLFKQYAVWYCNNYTAAPIFDYTNNPMFQELLLKSDYFGTKSDEKKSVLICGTVPDIQTRLKNRAEMTLN